MDIQTYIKRQVAASRRYLDSAIGSTPQELVNIKLGDHTNTIAAIYAHVIGGEDYFMNACIHGGQRIWERDGWGEKLGIQGTLGSDWTIQIPDLAAFEQYVKEVHAATDAFVETVTPDDLDRIVKVFGNERPVGNVLVTLANHAAGHGGELAALKGIHGVPGLPF